MFKNLFRVLSNKTKFNFLIPKRYIHRNSFNSRNNYSFKTKFEFKNSDKKYETINRYLKLENKTLNKQFLDNIKIFYKLKYDSEEYAIIEAKDYKYYELNGKQS